MFKLHMHDRELEHKCFQLAERARKATGEEKEKLVAELNESVKAHFKVRQERRTVELKRVEEQLARLRKTIETHEAKGEEVIKRRVSQLLGDDGLEF